MPPRLKPRPGRVLDKKELPVVIPLMATPLGEARTPLDVTRPPPVANVFPVVALVVAAMVAGVALAVVPLIAAALVVAVWVAAPLTAVVLAVVTFAAFTPSGASHSAPGGRLAGGVTVAALAGNVAALPALALAATALAPSGASTSTPGGGGLTVPWLSPPVWVFAAMAMVFPFASIFGACGHGLHYDSEGAV